VKVRAFFGIDVRKAAVCRANWTGLSSALNAWVRPVVWNALYLADAFNNDKPGRFFSWHNLEWCQSKARLTSANANHQRPFPLAFSFKLTCNVCPDCNPWDASPSFAAVVPNHEQIVLIGVAAAVSDKLQALPNALSENPKLAVD
jgi:hypothetical protein